MMGRGKDSDFIVNTRRLSWMIPLTTLTVLIAGCGASPVAVSRHSAKTRVESHHNTLSLGPTVLSTNVAWQLNSPGSGAPREEFSIESIDGARISIDVYVSEFGTLNEGILRGTRTSPKKLQLRGSLEEGTLSGTTKSIPMHLSLQPINAHTLWVSQYIQGNKAETYSQMPFTNTLQ